MQPNPQCVGCSKLTLFGFNQHEKMINSDDNFAPK